MSNGSVKFINLKHFEFDPDRQCKILIEYVLVEKVMVSHNDWVAIYPYGVELRNPDSLKFMVAYEFVLRGPTKKGGRKYKMELSLKGAKNIKYEHKYQLVYISQNSDIYGISETFEFHPPNLDEVSDKIDSCRESKENSEDNPFNDKKRKTSHRSQQPLVEVESGENESEDKVWSEEQKKVEAKKFINKFSKNKQVFVKKQMDMWSNSNSCVIPHPISPPISCSNCHRVAGLLRAQDQLYTKIKNLAEMNKDLLNQVAHLQRQVELTQAACQKLSVTLMRERQAKLFYQAAAEYDYHIMVVEPFLPSMVMPTRRNLPAPRKHSAEEKSKDVCSVLQLKAIIGNQETKIQSLTKEIVQMKRYKTRRVTASLKNTEEINSGKLESTHERSEITEEVN